MKTKNNNTETTYNSDITKDDIDALGKKGLRADSEDDRLLLDRDQAVDFQGKDLDIPGRNKTSSAIKKGITDEENTLFGQGGESKDNLEAPERANTSRSNK